MKHIGICFLFIFISSFISDNPKSQYNIPHSVWSVTTGDLDLDGDMDIVTGHLYNFHTKWSGISILENQGMGQFSLTDSVYFYGGGRSILCSQLDNNPLPEMICLKYDSTEFFVIIFNNNYADSVLLNTNSDQGIDFATLGDVDHNGLKDILFGSNQPPFWGILYNYGAKVFSAPEFHAITDYPPQDISCGDLNGDGREEVVVCGQPMEVYFSFYSGFKKQVYSDEMFDMAAVVDFDRDGYNDLIAVCGLPGTSIVIYQNQGDSNLLAMPETFFHSSSLEMIVNDFNNDLLPDLAFLYYWDYLDPDTVGRINILYNLGHNELSEPHKVPLTYYSDFNRHFSSSDLDGNGYQDFVIARTSWDTVPGYLEILFNDGNGNFIGTPSGIESFDSSTYTANFKCFPNPFSDFINLEFEINKTSLVGITIYDLQGRVIHRLVNEELYKGKHTSQWNGVDEAGNLCKPGTYIVDFKTDRIIQQSFKLIKF
jgi:hypothetical protein